MSEWKHGICGCCADVTNALLSYCCPCYVVGKVAEKVGDSCCMCGCLSLFAPVCIICMERGKVRAAHNIEGGVIGDCLYSWCCPCCALAQMANEMEEGAMAKDGGPVTMQPTASSGQTTNNSAVMEQPKN